MSPSQMESIKSILATFKKMFLGITKLIRVSVGFEVLEFLEGLGGINRSLFLVDKTGFGRV